MITMAKISSAQVFFELLTKINGICDSDLRFLTPTTPKEIQLEVTYT